MDVNDAIPLFGIILAGGAGTRFWPLSRSHYPKQVLRLQGSESMIQSTIERLLPRIPLSRLAAVLLDDEPEDSVMAVFPADHFIRDGESLLAALSLGAVWARAGYLVTFGIPPKRPETGYGYIKQGPDLDPEGRVRRAERFIEKPQLEKARSFLQAGGYYWNSGIFVFRRDFLLAVFQRYLPELHQALARSGTRPTGRPWLRSTGVCPASPWTTASWRRPTTGPSIGWWSPVLPGSPSVRRCDLWPAIIVSTYRPTPPTAWRTGKRCPPGHHRGPDRPLPRGRRHHPVGRRLLAS